MTGLVGKGHPLKTLPEWRHCLTDVELTACTAG